MQKSCQQCKQQFEITETDIAFYKKMKVSSPTHCPVCRMQRRLAYRNDRSLYHSKSALSGKEMISMYNPANNLIIYEQKEWWGDGWEPMKYGQNYDQKSDFFTQYLKLKKEVPRFNVFNKDTENCDFVNYAPHCKNCYLLFGSWFNQDCIYGQTLNESKNCIDNLFLDKSELCYENIDCNNNYNSFFCQNTNNATNCYFCFDCKNIKNCIGCYNIRNKEYHILNKQVSKEEFEKKVKSLSSYKNLQDFKSNYEQELKKNAIHKYMTGTNNENASGDFIFNSKNAKNCFSVYQGQDIAFSARAFDLKDSYDFEGGGKSTLLYENMSNDFSYESIGCTTCENLTNSHYCDLCFNCENCFGCVGLRRKQYCILNKQYSKDEYEKLVGQIIEKMKTDGQWGEFPPISHSLFAYNETMAQEYFPLTKEEAIKRGYKWKEDDDTNRYNGAIIALPDNIGETDEKITREILTCSECNKNYKIISQELVFLKKYGLPAPRLCPNCRHKKRMQTRNPRRLWARTCSKCSAAIQSAYDPSRPEIVYCEDCYLKELY